MFGGGNANSVYTPMSEDEQEALARILTTEELLVHIVGWGWVHNPKVTYGDLRVAIPIQITFDAPAVPMPVYEFTLELHTGSGVLLFRKAYDVRQNSKPIGVGAGFTLSMVWDIAIHHMDPALVKAYKPGATGLTSRWQDRDTGVFTFLGNTNMTASQRALLRRLREGEAEVRQNDAKRIAIAKKASGK